MEQRNFVRRRQCLVPTWQGWLLIAFFGCTLMVVAVLRVHSFLAVTERVQADVLVVEGWAPAYMLEEARAEFERHHYKKLYVTGGPVEIGRYLSEYKTYAELGAASLVCMGMDSETIEAVRVPQAQRDRTYTSALILERLLNQHAAQNTKLNVVTIGARARRTLLLFRKAFNDDSRVGVIAIDDRDYDPKQWWRFSQGVRNIVGELIAYAYARIVFPFISESECSPNRSSDCLS